jgi:ribosomal protein L32
LDLIFFRFEQFLNLNFSNLKEKKKTENKKKQKKKTKNKKTEIEKNKKEKMGQAQYPTRVCGDWYAPTWSVYLALIP